MRSSSVHLDLFPSVVHQDLELLTQESWQICMQASPIGDDPGMLETIGAKLSPPGSVPWLAVEIHRGNCASRGLKFITNSDECEMAGRALGYTTWEGSVRVFI